jgi:replicative DNA helicase
MAYGIGLKVLNKFCEEQNPIGWQKAKLSQDLFKAHEVPALLWVQEHLAKFHNLPKRETLCLKFPDCKEIETPESSAYYVDMLEHAFFYDRINQANIESQNILLANQDDYRKARAVLQGTLNAIAQQEYRNRSVELKAEGGKLAMEKYHAFTEGPIAIFGWPYLDEQSGGIRGEEVVSIVGRPASGKTYLSLWIGIANWKKGNNVLFASMEMERQSIMDRANAIYTHTPIHQLINKGFSKQTYDKFEHRLEGMSKETSTFHIVDGNLAATMEDIYTFADQFQCQTIIIDGAYLVRHKNAKLDRFNRAAENAELIKRYTIDLNACTFASWQFNREATKKISKKHKEDVGIEDIWCSDAIGQISSIVLGLFQAESVATMPKRDIRVLKGRNGEIGQFRVAWEFQTMNFSQTDPELKQENKEKVGKQWI